MNRQRSVKRIFSFSSGVLKMFDTAEAGLAWAIVGALLLDASAGGDALLARACAQADAFHLDGFLELTVCQDLELALRAVDQPSFLHRFGRDVAVDALEIAEANDLRLLAEWIREAALRHARRDRHLTALELRLAAART